MTNRASAPRPPAPDDPVEDGPTELVRNEKGELIERLSGGTATLLLVWLAGIGAASALLAVWLLVYLLSGTRLGISALFGGPGFYTALAGASGPCVLWLAGRAQGHGLRWFVLTAVKIGLVMLAILIAFVGVSMLVFGFLPGPGAPVAAATALLLTLMAAVIWGVATWSADRYIARARLRTE
jgi:hypothetical protein